MAAGGPEAVSDALGPSTPGIARLLRIADSAGTRDVSVTKADYTLTARVEPLRRQDHRRRRSQGRLSQLAHLHLDRRSGASQRLRHLPGAGHHRNHRRPALQWRRPRLDRGADGRPARPQPLDRRGVQLHHLPAGEIVEQLDPVVPDRGQFDRSDPDRLHRHHRQRFGQRIGDQRLHPLSSRQRRPVGTNTYGKPVGQIAVDRAACDDRLRVVAFKTENAARQGEYFDGLATKVEASCQAGDDLTRQFGDPQEASTRAALDFLAGRACTRIAAASGITTQAIHDRRELLTPERPSPAQREVPGTF
jgi:carboxyl-terminal processing protease